METYHRKRTRNGKPPSTAANCMETQDQKSNVNTDQGPDKLLSDMDKQDGLLPSSGIDTFNANAADETPTHNIEVGSIYEIDQSSLPPRTPVQLKAIRVAMVSEKTELNVSVRFPSVESLYTYFSNRVREMYPALDEKFVMGTQLGEKVLLRQIPTQEFAESKHLESFWLVNPTSDVGFVDVTCRKGDCLSELKCNGMLRWGVRRQVKFLGKHDENTNPQSSSSFVRGEDKVKGIEDAEEDDIDEPEQEADDDDEEEEALTEEAPETDKKRHKRKQYSFRNNVRKGKKVKHEKEKLNHITKAKNKCRLLELKNPKDRWSSERYKLAEKNLLAVMKAKGAVFGNPIMRPQLRAEARKKIGDTGLLDHLLKHMAGKIAPGGEQRFRRRHNADGAMEYWLESADLVKIRREAGVQDPYWTPPPGWQPGDCPTQDPNCAQEFRLLKAETAKMKREMEEMKKQSEAEVSKLRRELEELLSKTKQEENQVVVAAPGLISPKDHTLLESSKSDLSLEVVSLEKYQKQLTFVTDFLREMEEKARKLTSNVEERTRSPDSFALIASTEACAEREKKQPAGAGDKKPAVPVQLVAAEGSDQGKEQPKTTAERTEEKAAKIQRLKSGFRICKPQGTFLWPNMVRGNNNNDCNNSNMLSPQVVVQVEDMAVVPTPPSVSSSSASAPPQLPYYPHHHHKNPASPVKPLAERRAVTVTVSTVAGSRFEEDHVDNNTSNNSAITAVNFNDVPNTSGIMPRMVPWEVLGKGGSGNICKGSITEPKGTMGYNQLQEERGGHCSSSSVSSGLSAGAKSWLALATPMPPVDDSSR